MLTHTAMLLIHPLVTLIGTCLNQAILYCGCRKMHEIMQVEVMRFRYHSYQTSEWGKCDDFNHGGAVGTRWAGLVWVCTCMIFFYALWCCNMIGWLDKCMNVQVYLIKWRVSVFYGELCVCGGELYLMQAEPKFRQGLTEVWSQYQGIIRRTCDWTEAKILPEMRTMSWRLFIYPTPETRG